MTKEQLKEYLKKVLADSKRKPHGKNEYEKANDKLQIDGNLRMFATGIQEGMYMLPVNKLKEAEKFFSEKDLVSARNSFLSSTITHYIEDNKIDQNLISDELKAYKASYYKADYDRYKDAISTYISKDEYENALKSSIKKKGQFYHGSEIHDVVKKILESKNVDKKTINNINDQVSMKMTPTVDEIKNACSTIIPKEEFDKNTGLQPHNYFSSAGIKDKEEKLINFIAENLDPKEYDNLVKKINDNDVQINKPEKDISVPLYQDEVKNLEKQNLTKEQKDAVKYISENFVKTNDEYNSEIDSYRSSVEDALKNDEDKITEQDIKKSGLDIVLTKREFFNVGDGNLDDFNVSLKDESNEEKLHEYDNQEFKFSANTQKNIVGLLDKMDEYGIISDHAIAESGIKIYGLHQLSSINGQIDEAMRQGKAEELPKLVQDHKKIDKQYGEILDNIDKNFPVHEGNMAYGGNIDVARNTNFAPKYRRDIPKVSTFNGLYLIGSFCKANNYKYEDFIQTPYGKIKEKFAEYTKKINAEPEDYKGKSPAHMIFDMQDAFYRMTPNASAFIRVMENLSDFEKDPKLRQQNKTVYKNYEAQAQAFTAYTSIREGQRNNKDLFQRVMLVPEEERGYHLVGNTYDPVQMKIVEHKPFDDIDYIQNNQIDLKEFNQKLKTSIIDYQKLDEEARKDPTYMASLSVSEFVATSHKLASKIVALKPELKNDPEYQNLLKFVKDPKTVANEWTGKDLALNDDDFVETKNIAKDINDYVKKQSKKSKSFGKPIVDKDKRLNNMLKNKSEIELQNMSKEINDRKKELTQEFRDGKVTEHYYKKRMEQLNNKDFKSNIPPMFEIDKMPSQKEYMKQNDLEDLPKDDQKLVYQHAKDKAQRDKENFFRRQYLREEEIDKNPIYTLEETNPELKGADKIISPKVEEVYTNDQKLKDILNPDMIRTTNDYESEIDNESELNDSLRIENEVNEMERIHVDLDDEITTATNMVNVSNKEKTRERDSISSNK